MSREYNSEIHEIQCGRVCSRIEQRAGVIDKTTAFSPIVHYKNIHVHYLQSHCNSVHCGFCNQPMTTSFLRLTNWHFQVQGGQLLWPSKLGHISLFHLNSHEPRPYSYDLEKHRLSVSVIATFSNCSADSNYKSHKRPSCPIYPFQS